MKYYRAQTLAEALTELSRTPRRVVCGGTDVYAEAALVRATPAWLDISGIAALRSIGLDSATWRIGAASTWADIDDATALPASLREAARSTGSRQILVQATLGGNLCHASPSADGVPPLLTLEAQVELASARGTRTLPLDQFILGRRRTALAPDELLTAIIFAAPSVREQTAFVKCSNREGTALAVVSAALRLRWREDGALARAWVAIGGASEVAVRLRGLEALMEGAARDDLREIIETAPMPELSPIDDSRGSAGLRRHLARIAVARACAPLLEGAAHGLAA